MSRGSSPFTRIKPKRHPPVQQQLDMLMRGIDRLAQHLSELELAVEFTMRQVRMGRVKPGGIIDPATGKMPMEHINLSQLFEHQRDAFVAMLIEERNAIARAQQAASEFDHGHAPAEGNGAAGASAPADNICPDCDAPIVNGECRCADVKPVLDRATGLYIIGGES